MDFEQFLLTVRVRRFFCVRPGELLRSRHEQFEVAKRQTGRTTIQCQPYDGLALVQAGLSQAQKTLSRLHPLEC